MIKYILIAAVAILLAAYYYYRSQPELKGWRRFLLAALRSISIALILLLIISPIIYYVHSKIDQPILVVLKDISQSMDLKSGAKSKDSILAPKQNELIADYKAKGYKIVNYDFAEGLSDNRSNTMLAPVLEQIPKDHKLSRIHSILLASDGWLKDESLLAVKQLNIPFHVLMDTTAVTAADLILLSAKADKFAYRNEPSLIRAEIKAENKAAKVNVQLKINGKKVNEKTIEIAANSAISTDFIHRFPQTGFYNYSVEIRSDELQERSLNNNIFPGAIEVLSEKEKIFVISDQPGWDNKFIIDALKSNPRWEITHYSIQNQRLFSNNKAMNTWDSSNLAAMIIINNGALKLGQNLVNQILSLHNKGTGILYQGMPVAELNDALPIRASNISSSYQGFLKWNPEAESYPMLKLNSGEYSNIPPVDYFYTVTNPGAITAISMDNPQKSAGIVFRAVANKRSIGISFLNLWRWQMQSPSSTYQSMITNMVVWLTNQSKDGFNAIYNQSYFLGEKISIRLRSEDEIRESRLNISPHLEIFDAEDKSVYKDFMALSAGEFAGEITLSKAGNYRFMITDKESGKRSSGKFTISDASMEMRDFDFNLPLLSWLAFETGGSSIPVISSSGTPKTYSPPPAQNFTQVYRDEIALYKKWYILLLFILAFSVELFFRRRWGLL